MFALINPEKLSDPKVRLRDIAATLTLAVAGGVSLILGQITAAVEINFIYRCLAGAAVIGAPVLYLYLLIQKTKKADEFIQREYTRAALSSAIWIVLYMMIGMLWVNLNPAGLHVSMGPHMIFAMPWFAALYAYISTRIQLRRLTKDIE